MCSIRTKRQQSTYAVCKYNFQNKINVCLHISKVMLNVKIYLYMMISFACHTGFTYSYLFNIISIIQRHKTRLISRFFSMENLHTMMIYPDFMYVRLVRCSKMPLRFFFETKEQNKGTKYNFIEIYI